MFCKLAVSRAVGDIATSFPEQQDDSTYRARILEKMNSKSNADLTYYAIKNGLIQ